MTITLTSSKDYLPIEPAQEQDEPPPRTPRQQRADRKREQFQRMGLLNQLLKAHQPPEHFNSFFHFP